MRSIVQSREPLALRKWKRINRELPQVLVYPPPSDVLEAIKNALHTEQAGLCAYTSLVLPAADDGHVEHIEPRKHQPDKALDYTNLALCFPPSGGNVSFGYGAPVKGGKQIQLNVDFVSPHSKGCEKRFIYKSNGEVLPAPNDTAAAKTINTVQLNCKQLQELRQAAIAAHGVALRQGRSRRPMSRRTAADAKRLAKDILSPNPSGMLGAFCEAIAQVALDYANRENAHAKRVKNKKGG